MKLLVCGSRDFFDREVIEEAIKEYCGVEVLIHGNAKGADQIAGSIGMSLGFEVIPVDAQWGLYGRAAGPNRNQKMLVTYRPDEGLAFFSRVEASKGTADMVCRLVRSGLKTKCYEKFTNTWFWATKANKRPSSLVDLIINQSDIISSSAFWREQGERNGYSRN